MNKKPPSELGYSSQLRRNKKRSKRSMGTHEFCYNNDRARDRDKDRDRDRDRDSYEGSEDEVPHAPHVPGMEYTPMFWPQQPPISQARHHSAHNGQRLFTAMSDPSVCGYSAVPVTYAMEPVSMPPMYRLYQPVGMKPSYRLYRGKARSSLMRMQSGPPCSGDIMRNGYSSLQENSWDQSTPIAYQNGDYASLPPTANVDNKDNGQDLSSEHRRYSDPGLGPADNLPINSKDNDDSDSGDSNSSVTTVGKNNKLLYTLFDQMTKMKDTNNQLFKELHQAKLDLETIKTELQQIKQNVSCDYQPGMLSDVIREIVEASKIKEEAMFAKMKLLIESQQSEKCVEVDQLKSQLEQVRREKEEGEERISKLEKEVAALRLGMNSCYSDGSSSSTSESREIAAFEEENLALRRELQEARVGKLLTTTALTTTTATTTTTTTSTNPASSGGGGASSNIRLERLMGILREKSSQPSYSEDREQQRAVGSSNASSNSDEDEDEDDEDEDDDDDDDDDEEEEQAALPEAKQLKLPQRLFLAPGGSCDNSINSTAAPTTAGPVTDL